MVLEETQEQADQRLMKLSIEQAKIAEENGLLDGSEILRCGGSGAKSQMWNQIKADVLDKKLQTLERTDLTTFGTAVIGAVGIGIYNDVSRAVKYKIRIVEEVLPGKNRKKYEHLFHLYKKINSRIENIYNDLC